MLINSIFLFSTFQSVHGLMTIVGEKQDLCARSMRTLHVPSHQHPHLQYLAIVLLVTLMWVSVRLFSGTADRQCNALLISIVQLSLPLSRNSLYLLNIPRPSSQYMPSYIALSYPACFRFMCHHHQHSHKDWGWPEAKNNGKVYFMTIVEFVLEKSMRRTKTNVRLRLWIWIKVILRQCQILG